MSLRSKHGGSSKSITVVQYDSSKITSDRRSNGLKVAVETGTVAGTQLCEIHPSKSLNSFISNIVKDGNDPSSWALLWVDRNKFITEQNRHEVSNGSLLKLVTAPTVAVERILKELKRSYTGNIDTYKRLSLMSKDSTFANEFLQKGGLQTVLDNIESDSCVGEALAHSLASVLDLMDYNTTVWEDVVSKKFLLKVVNHASVLKETDVTIHQHCLAILECVINSSEKLFKDITEMEFSLALIKPHLEKSLNPKLQLRAISVANAIMMKNPIEIKKNVVKKRITSISEPPEVTFRDIRQAILNNIIRSNTQVDSDMAHQLHVFQAFTFNRFKARMLSKVNPQDKEQRDNVLELAKLAFDHTADTPTSRKPPQSPSFNIAEFRKLGFSDCNNPVLEFNETPPGLLALDCMRYFATTQQDNYIKLVLENSSRSSKDQCPYAKSSIELVKNLCNLLQVGELPTETSEEYYPIVFTHDRILQELYCVGIILLNKTWKEMNAISEDFDKVMSVINEQLSRAMDTKPTSVDQLKTKLNNIPYSEIIRLRQIARQDKEDLFTRAKPVLELQEHIRPKIVQLIEEQRINMMLEGAVFNRLSGKKYRDKLHWYCRLSPNLKYLHFGDLENTKDKPTVDELPNKISITDIREVLTGKNCPHIKNIRSQHKVASDLAFSVHYDPDNYLNFMAPDITTWCWWTDGLNKLTNKKMTSRQMQQDMEILLTMELKIKLLDLETIPILDQAPPLPPLPDNFNYATDF